MPFDRNGCGSDEVDPPKKLAKVNFCPPFFTGTVAEARSDPPKREY